MDDERAIRAEISPAVRNILARRESARGAGGGGSGAGDRRRIGLVVQGGAMRGVFTAGCVCGLEALGVGGECFDVAFGSSGGAINAAYLFAGQAAYGTSIYYTDINNRLFIDFRRLARGTALDIDYCFEEVIGRRKRLDLERVLASPAALAVLVTDADDCRPLAVEQREARDARELLTLLKGSAAMPLVYRRPVLFRGRRIVDGAFLVPVPLLEAIADGCTDILVLLSRPLAHAPASPPAWLLRLVFRSINARATAAIAAAWAAGQERLAHALAIMRRGDFVREDGAAVNLEVVAPAAPFAVNRWTTDRRTLVDAALAGAVAVCERFGVPRDELQPHAGVRLRDRGDGALLWQPAANPAHASEE